MNERKVRPSQPPDTTSTLAAIGPVARSSVVDAVADRLRGEILSGRLAPGSRLPSERELSLALGVNRLTLRASLARLEALGLISTRHGAGTVVASWRERAGLDTLMTLISALKPGDPALHELLSATLEVRRILASEAIALAAKRRTDDDIRMISESAEAMKTKVDDPLAYARADVVFMRVVVRAARNVGLELLLNTFARFPDEQPALVVSLYDKCAEAVALYPLVVELIRGGDADVARETVRRALERMDEAWVERHAPPRAKSGASAQRRKR